MPAFPVAMAQDIAETPPGARTSRWRLWVAGPFAGLAVMAGGLSLAGAGTPILFPLTLLVISVALVGLHATHRPTDRQETLQRGERLGAAVGVAVRGAIAAGGVYWFLRDWIHGALRPAGVFDEPISFAARVFALTPLASIVLLFSAAAIMELMPKEKRPPKWALLVVALIFVAVFVWAAYASITFTGNARPQRFSTSM